MGDVGGVLVGGPADAEVVADGVPAATGAAVPGVEHPTTVSSATAHKAMGAMGWRPAALTVRLR